MNDRRRGDSLYTTVLLAFLVGLVGLGLLGVPALLVAAIGAAVAAIGILLLHRRRTGADLSGARRRGTPDRVPAKYVPSVLEGSSARRRRIVHPRRHRQAPTPLRFR
jgi:hypothetical protein